MAHPNEEAGEAPMNDMDSAAAALDAFYANQDEGIDNPPANGDETEDQSQDEGDLDLDDDQDAGDGEPQKAAIEAPVSLTPEEKAKFAQLPEEAQRYVADLESRRAEQVQKATTKAAEAQRAADQRAALADAQAKGVYAQQLKAFADQLAPQRPDPQMAYSDPQAFIALNAQYEAAKAQHDEFVQQVTALSTEAGAQITQAEIAERDAALMSIPEVQNEETRNAFFEKGIETAKELGLDLSALGNATAGEWKALRQVSEWKEDSVKYRAALAKQMQRVREGKRNPTAKPGAAQPMSQDGKGLRDAKQRLRQSGDLRDAAAAIARLG